MAQMQSNIKALSSELFLLKLISFINTLIIMLFGSAVAANTEAFGAKVKATAVTK